RLGVTSFAFSTKVTPEVLADTWEKFDLNVIQGVPAFTIPLLNAAHKINPKIKFEKFIFAGQALSQRDSEWLKNDLGVKTISSIIGANDGGQIAFQCKFLSGAEHHVVDDFNYIEVVGADGERVPDGSAGDVLITSLHKYAFPLIRYAIGDRAKFIDKKCECGRTNRIIEYLGRSDSIISVGFLNLDYKDIQKSLIDFSPSVVQVVIDQSDEGLDQILLRIETPDKLDPEVVRKAVLKNLPVISDRIKEQKLGSFRTEVYQPGELPRDSRSAKVKAFLDLR
ncbi:hypothetical protein N9D31_04265, partial [Oligoflexaceae bacterium]|nr:hypothetical protein [Oligoflexaceae bacterium]